MLDLGSLAMLMHVWPMHVWPMHVWPMPVWPMHVWPTPLPILSRVRGQTYAWRQFAALQVAPPRMQWFET